MNDEAIIDDDEVRLRAERGELIRLPPMPPAVVCASVSETEGILSEAVAKGWVTRGRAKKANFDEPPPLRSEWLQALRAKAAARPEPIPPAACGYVPSPYPAPRNPRKRR